MPTTLRFTSLKVSLAEHGAAVRDSHFKVQLRNPDDEFLGVAPAAIAERLIAQLGMDRQSSATPLLVGNLMHVRHQLTTGQYHVTDARKVAFRTWVNGPLEYARIREPAHPKPAYLEWADADAARGQKRAHITHHQPAQRLTEPRHPGKVQGHIEAVIRLQRRLIRIARKLGNAPLH